MEEYKKYERMWTRRLLWIALILFLVLINSAAYVLNNPIDAYTKYFSITRTLQIHNANNTVTPWTVHFEVSIGANFNETLTYIELKDNWNSSAVQIAGFHSNITLRMGDTLSIDASFPNKVMDGDVVDLTLKFETFSTRVSFTPFPVQVTMR